MNFHQNSRRDPVVRLALLVLMTFIVFIASAQAAQPVRIGVLAFRPKAITLEQWQPLAGVFKQSMPGREFVIEAFTLPEMEKAVAANELDFVLTNSGHYVLLSKRYGLTSPIATLVVDESGKLARSFGGVIFTRAAVTNIDTLSSLRGKTIAIVNTDSLGAYQMQAYELKRAGVRLPLDAKLVVTGLPQDNVVEAVLDGRADVGFVRTGVLEALVREGKLDASRLKVLNPQHPPGFPVQISTHLYPEWPFAALPHVDEHLARHVAASLFMLEADSAAAKAMKIHGFVIPGDYASVAEVLRELRAPPFEQTPLFTLDDVIIQYRWQILASLFAGGLVMFLMLRLMWTKRKLHEEHRLVLRQQQQMRHMAFYDMLTLLPNRRLLHDRLGQALAASNRSKRYAALMFLDLDNFKPLNDTHGHEVGDLLLIEVARRLKACVREVDTVARLGGDEFVVLLSELGPRREESAVQAGIVAEKIRAALSEPYRLTIAHEDKSGETVEHHCSASIGVTLFLDHDGRPEDILKLADAAMYRAKELGRNRIHFSDEKA
ncbi:MAG: PhnD/SsuA/transferrin family substrate-binding protein [Gammaproteobacteria bacterium]|nr:PhnD/SsuA/transferrin family substrate-binding protein [Gammaproteobacteria bacterium]MBU1777852.1 PhnD/SsuA/transferrin family substrate-binding protein [Gammaproteobacteria bacterium]MBU1969286.1 PhnD/SsuA/transferrin family substrate-binding protein [Gammaproteobacteria bacterium]